MLLHFQQSAYYLTRGQVLMLESAFIEDLEDMPLLSLTAFPFPFLSFSLHSVTGNVTCMDVPHSEADACANLELPHIQDFLSTTCKPNGMDEAALKKFLKQAMKFFIHNSQLWHQGPSHTH